MTQEERALPPFYVYGRHYAHSVAVSRVNLVTEGLKLDAVCSLARTLQFLMDDETEEGTLMYSHIYDFLQGLGYYGRE